MYNIMGKNFDLGGEVTTEDILKDIIEADQQSQKKIEMVQGVNYYNSVNDILQRDFREYYINGIKYIDYNKSNDRIVNNLHKKLVDQKVGYIAGKPIVFSADDKKLTEAVNNLLGDKWNDIANDWIKGAANKGEESIQPFVDENGEFDYCIIPNEQVIYITDTSYQKKVVQGIRYYSMEWVVDGEVKKSNRVELWDDEKVTRYQEVEDGFGSSYYDFIQPGTLGVQVNPQYHWYTYNTNFTDKSQLNSFNDVEQTGVQGNSWGRVPIISLLNNTEERSDLMPIKKYIDALDIVSSGFVNDLKDIQLAIWVLRGYEAESEDGGLGEFMQNLMTFKAITLSNDDSSSAEPKTMDIPKEARVALMGWLEQKIYEVGQGVNLSKISGGSLTNVFIEAMFSDLNIKSEQLIIKMKKALSEFMYFVVEFINDRDGTNYNYKDITFTFNTSTIFNKVEMMKALATQGVRVSKTTLLKHHPLVDDVEEEKKLIKEEDEAELDNMNFEPIEPEVKEGEK